MWHPYKRHPVNAGKNCLNGRNSIDCYKNKFGDVDADALIADVSKELSSASDVTVICSGNSGVGEIEAIKEFAESKGYNIGFYLSTIAIKVFSFKSLIAIFQFFH